MPSSRFAALSAAFDAAKDAYRAVERFHNALHDLAVDDYSENLDLYHLYHSVNGVAIRQARDEAQRLLHAEPDPS